jgi:hypothetical protein
MMRTRLVVVCLVSIACLISVTTFAGDAETKAVEAAKSWLALVDAGDYGESWTQSADLFRKAVTPDKWEQALNASRKPFGDLVSREVKSTQYFTSLPGAPDGEYVVIQFTTSFENKKDAVETITPMKDPDGVWRVSGYFIK